MSKRKAEEPESAEDAAKRQKCEAKAAITAAKLVAKAIDTIMDAQRDAILESDKKLRALARTLVKAATDEYEAVKASKPSAAALAVAKAAYDHKVEANDKKFELAFNASQDECNEHRAVYKALAPAWEYANNERVNAKRKLLQLTQVLSLRGVMLSAAHKLYAVRVEKRTGLVRHVVHNTPDKILQHHADEQGPYAWYIVATDEKRFALKFHLIPEPNEMKFKLHASGGSCVPDPRLFHVSLNVPGGVWTIPQAYAMLTAPTAKPLERLGKDMTIDAFTRYVMGQVMGHWGVMWHVDSPAVVLPFDDDNDTDGDDNGKPPSKSRGTLLSEQLEAARSSALVICP